MKTRNFLLVTIFCILTFGLYAQWEWQNPLPQGNTITALSFIDENKGWAVGWGTIMCTTDGGLTWSVKQSDFGDFYYDLQLNDVCFTDELHGWIVGGMPGFIYHTADGGQSWSDSKSECPKLPQANTDVFFIDNQIGWVLGWAASIDGVYILRTTDGGDSWDSNEVCELLSFDGGLYFISNTNGWVVWGHKILHTTDGGVTWEVQFNDDNAFLSDVYFMDADHGWAVGEEGAVLITSNGGVNWEYSADPALSGNHLRAVSFVSPSDGWCCGYSAYAGNQHNGTILKTSDGGQSWEAQIEVNSHLPVFCLSNNMQLTGIAGGENGLILKLNDNGSQWIALSSTFTECYFNDVFFTDPNNGWAAGGIAGEPLMIPSIFNTKDGGTSWTEQELDFPGPGIIIKIFFTDSLHGWVTGLHFALFNIYLINTIDGGETWEVQSSSYHELSNFYFVNNSVGWRVGESGTVQKTSDGGWNWEDQSSGTDKNLNSIFFIDEMNGWIAGDSLILHTPDGGQSWSEQSILPYPWTNVFFLDEQVGWVTFPLGGCSGKTIKTMDGGQSWEEVNDIGFHEVVFFDADTGLGRASTQPSGGASSPPVTNIFRTKDGGLTWEPQSVPTLIQGGFCFIDYDNGWAVSSNGAILHYDYVGASGINDKSNFYYGSEIRCYPNPFSISTTIGFNMPESGQVHLVIYNQLGEKVAVLANELKPAGSHKIIWNTAGNPVGIYFCRLQAGNRIISEKMILMK